MHDINSNQLTTEEIQEFKRLVKKTKNIELTYEEAEDQALRSVQLFELLMGSNHVQLRGLDVVEKSLSYGKKK